MDKKLEIIVVEDDKTACAELIREIDDDPHDFRLIGTTNNSSKAFDMVVESRPDAVILDLELHQGGGDGLDFLKRLQDEQLNCNPFILVTTNNVSEVTHEIARGLGADFIMTKNQEGYSAKSVLDFLKLTKTVILNRRKTTRQEDYDSPTLTEKRLQRRICLELDKIGISAKSIGYTYLLEAITVTVHEPTQRICDKIAKKHGKTPTSVERAMQNAINRAWSTSSFEELLENYTAKIKSDKGVPTLTEFIYYYAQKIKHDF